METIGLKECLKTIQIDILLEDVHYKDSFEWDILDPNQVPEVARLFRNSPITCVKTWDYLTYLPPESLIPFMTRFNPTKNNYSRPEN